MTVVIDYRNEDQTVQKMRSKALRGGIRIATLDAWRGLAALMVVTLHAVVPAFDHYPKLRSNLFYKHIVFGNYGVQIFFVVSGFCVAQAALRALGKPAPLTDFAYKRICRIYPPYLIVTVLSILLSAAAAHLVTRHILPNSLLGDEKLFARPAIDYVCSALMLQHVCHVEPFVPVFWTLCYEAAFYVLVAGALTAASRFGRDSLLLDLCHALTLACSVGLLVLPLAVPYPFSLWPEFGLGILALDVLTQRRPVAYGLLLATIIPLSIYAWNHSPLGSDYVVTAGMRTVVSIVFCLILIIMNPVDEWIARLLPMRLLAHIGVFSYSLYLLHWLVLGPIAQIVKKLHYLSAETYWLSALAQIFAAILAARIFYMFAERPFLTRRRTQIDTEAVLPNTILSVISSS